MSSNKRKCNAAAKAVAVTAAEAEEAAAKIKATATGAAVVVRVFGQGGLVSMCLDVHFNFYTVHLLIHKRL